MFQQTMTKLLMNLTIATLLTSTSVIPLSGCADPSALITGTATYRERIALPPGTVFEAVLLDVSLADTIARQMGSVTIEDPGNVPIQFKIPYDPAAIKEGHSYSVRGRILLGDKLLFTTDTHYPVITRGNGQEVDLLLRLIAVP